MKLKNVLTNICGAVFALVIGHGAVTAQTIDSTNALKFACENNPGNSVTVGYPMKINNGGTPELPESVNTGCTIVLTGSGSFETDQVGMNFNGAFSIQAANQTQIRFVKSLWSATSMNISATGNGSLLGVNESLLATTVGDFTANVAFDSVVEFDLPLSGRLSSVESAGMIGISGGSGKFTGSLKETRLTASNGISVSMGGAEGTFTADRSHLATTNGGVTISSQGTKSLVELSFGEVRAANGVTVTLPGSEGNLLLQNMLVNSGAGSVAFNVARVGNVGKIGVFSSRLTSGSEVSILASLNGRTGLAAVEDSIINATNTILVQTGRVGETIVKTSNMNAGNSITFRTGLAGKCLAEQNVLIAPFVRACR